MCFWFKMVTLGPFKEKTREDFNDLKKKKSPGKFETSEELLLRMIDREKKIQATDRIFARG